MYMELPLVRQYNIYILSSILNHDTDYCNYYLSILYFCWYIYYIGTAVSVGDIASTCSCDANTEPFVADFDFIEPYLELPGFYEDKFVNCDYDDVSAASTHAIGAGIIASVMFGQALM